MPTIEIPDKLCIKCGSIRWRVNPTTSFKRCTDCSNANSRKNHKIGSSKAKYHKNIEKYRNISKLSQKKYRDKNKSKLYFLAYQYAIKQKKNLGDLYVKATLTKHSRELCFKDITPELIELKRKQLILTRTIKNHGN